MTVPASKPINLVLEQKRGYRKCPKPAYRYQPWREEYENPCRCRCLGQPHTCAFISRQLPRLFTCAGGSFRCSNRRQHHSCGQSVWIKKHSCLHYIKGSYLLYPAEVQRKGSLGMRLVAIQGASFGGVFLSEVKAISQNCYPL